MSPTLIDQDKYEDLKNNVISEFFIIETGRIKDVHMFGIDRKMKEIDIWVWCLN